MQKFKNVKKLLMKFSRGEELNVPTTSIAEIKIDGEGDDNSEGGTGLTGNLLDDWVTAVTQGEYTKYEDVPVAEAGANTGWKRRGSTTLLSYIAFSVFGGDDPDIAYELYRNPECPDNAIV